MTKRSDRYWLIPLAFFAMPALAAYKCIDESGAVLYQDGPCPPNMRGGEMRLNANRSFSGQASTPESMTRFVPLPPNEAMLPVVSETTHPAKADQATDAASAPAPAAEPATPATASVADRPATDSSPPSAAPDATTPATTPTPPVTPTTSSPTQNDGWLFHIDGSQ